MIEHNVFWQRTDKTGIEWFNLISYKSKLLKGVVLLHDQEEQLRVYYKISTDQNWRVEYATISAWQGNEVRYLNLIRDDTGWLKDGIRFFDNGTIHHLDFNLTPSTNLLPIRSCELEIGDYSQIHVLWIDYQDLSIAVKKQQYTRLDALTYLFESLDTGYSTSLEVDEFGCILDYPGYWERI